jgi:ribonuclease III
MTMPPGRQQQLEKLLARLGLTQTAAVQWSLLDLALTHISLSATCNYEQLELVGDAVLRLFVAQMLWNQNREGTVGQWTAVRSILVSDRILSDIAYTFGLERFLLVSPSAERDPKGAPSRLANSLEAVIGALYLSTQDFSLIDPWLRPELNRHAETIRQDPTYQNYKAALQQWTQAHHRLLPTYRVEEHAEQAAANRFRAEVWLNEQHLGSGEGPSRKAAEKAAAKAAFEKLSIEEVGPIGHSLTELS